MSNIRKFSYELNSLYGILILILNLVDFDIILTVDLHFV